MDNIAPSLELQVSAHPKIKMDTINFSNLKMSSFSGEQGRTRIYDEAYLSYVEKVNPRRTQIGRKRAISGWKIVNTGRR